MFSEVIEEKIRPISKQGNTCNKMQLLCDSFHKD